jgi:LDH2 family malate/lactate/ureidoglycolate dehydrogenase
MAEIRIAAEVLRIFARDVFVARGAAREDAEISADVLLAADLRGIDTHGISRLKYYSDRLKSGITRAAVKLDIVSETPTTAVIDCNLGLGHASAARAMTVAIEKAKHSGLGAVAVRNATHFGIAGYFPLLAEREGMIGIAMTNARPAVAPTFSTQPMFGTNPIAVAAPTDEEFPFWFDAALSTVQRGNIEVAAREGEPLPGGWAVDENGNAVTDAKALLRKLNDGSGALLALGGAGEDFGGHKGFGLSLIVELLCAALQNGDYLTKLAGGVEGGSSQTYRLGHFFLAINVGAFIPLASFRKTAGDMMRELRGARRSPGATRIWTPGEKEFATMQIRNRQGIPVGPQLLAELQALAAESGIAPGPG